MENKRFEISAGQEVLMRPTGNNMRGWKGELICGTIQKIARKYFYVQIVGRPWSNERFFIEDFSHDDGDTNAGYILYENQEAFKRDVEHETMFLEISRYFSRHIGEKPSYETVKAIYELLHREDLI